MGRMSSTKVTMLGKSRPFQMFEKSSFVRFMKGQGVTAFDVLNLTMSIFFFGNSLISFKTANNIIQEVQNEVITNTTNQLDTKKSKAGFERLMKNTEGDTPIEKNARVIRTLNSIENPKEFFTKTFKLTKEVPP